MEKTSQNIHLRRMDIIKEIVNSIVIMQVSSLKNTNLLLLGDLETF